MTFDEGLERNLPSRMPKFTEDGITASGGIAYFGVPSAAHIDHFGTPFSSSLDLFLASGEMFIAESVMIRASGTEYCAFPCEDGLFDDTYDGIRPRARHAAAFRRCACGRRANARRRRA
jgi:hypothetical protein